MKPAVYILCTLVSLICAVLLLRGYRNGRHRLLLWSGLCFAGLTLNNALLVLDKIVLSATDLSLPRTLIALLSMMILLYGLIWEAE